MTNQEIITHLANSRGAMCTEKRDLIIKYFPGASPAFINLSSLSFHVMLLLFVCPNSSLIRIYEHARLKSSIVIRILLKFELIEFKALPHKHVYNITPLTRLIINDLISAYKHNLNTFYALNKADKNTDYNQIKAKIKHLKQK